MNLKLSLFAFVLLAMSAGFALAQEAETNPTSSTEATTIAGGDQTSSSEATTPAVVDSSSTVAGGDVSSAEPVVSGVASEETTTPEPTTVTGAADAGGETPSSTEAASSETPSTPGADAEATPATPAVVAAPSGIAPVAGGMNPLAQAKSVLDWFSAILSAIRCIMPNQCLYDVSVDDPIKGKLQACNAFIEQYAEKAVAPKDLDKTVKASFESPKSAKVVPKANAPVLAATFRCCHVVNSKDYIKETKGTGKYAAPTLAKDQSCEKVVDSLVKVMIEKNNKKEKV